MVNKHLKINDYQMKLHPDFFNPIHGLIKKSTIRLDKKPIHEHDLIYLTFPPTGKKLLVEIQMIYTIKYGNLTHAQAMYEGYRHVDLLKHELKNIYPDITDDTLLYVYHFTIKTNENGDIVC